MNTGLITLLDSDSEYVKQLGAYLETHTNIGYKSSVFTDINSFIEFSSSNHSDILLINQTLFNSIPLHKLSFDNLFLLGENKSDNCIIRDEISYDIFFKYQSAEHLTHKIMSNLSVHKICKKNDSSNSSVYISGIYSPVKRCGRTCFSIALAMIPCAPSFLTIGISSSNLDFRAANVVSCGLFFSLINNFFAISFVE